MRYNGILELTVKDKILYLQFFHSKHDQVSLLLSGRSLLQLTLSLQAQVQIWVDMFCQTPTSDNAVCLY